MPTSDSDGPLVNDLRMVAVAATAWSGCLCAAWLGGWSAAAVAAFLVVARSRQRRTTALALAVVFVGAAGCFALREGSVAASPVRPLAEERASGTFTFVVRSDPRTTSGRFGDRLLFRSRLYVVEARGMVREVRTSVLVMASTDWRGIELGERIVAKGRLSPSDSRELAAILSVRGPPRVIAGAGALLRGAEEVREGIRRAVATQPDGPRALVPALVDGDDARMSADLVEDFRTTGLTHLTAVSGTNLTLLIGFLLILARAMGVQARGLMAVGAVGVVGFVLLARTEPSVVRAAVMGSVALIGMGLGRLAGTRSLAVAVTVLLLVDPWLSRSPGFVLSVSATAGILFLGPVWRDQLATWLPRWLAEALAVPLAAQLACTPMVAALSGQVSLAAVGANLLVAPVVGPVTVFGLLGGLLAVAWEWGGQWLAAPAGWCSRWIIWVAVHGADLALPAFDVGLRPVSLVVLTATCIILGFTLGPLLGRRWPTLVVTALLCVLVTVPLPRPGWPPPRWIAVMCDVGQGDGIVIRTGVHEGLVVDAGPDPQPIDRCLERLRIDRVTAVVLTHFHADHIDGLSGVLDQRDVGAIVVTSYAEPASGADRVHRAAQAAQVPVVTAAPGEVHRRGDATWQVLAPTASPPTGSASPPNDASVVLLVEIRGVTLLLLGDQESGSQQELVRAWPDLRADVLKVAHHGSATQDSDLIGRLGSRLALVSVGEGNDYGHPAPRLLGLLRDARMQVRRTDLDGDIAVIEDGGLRVQTSR